jgi:hypothetical protein
MAYDPPDYGGYARQSADVQSQYNSQSSANAYGRFVGQQRGNRSLGDTYRNYKRQTPKFQSGLAQRGVAGPGIGGGVMNQAMGRYVGDFARQYGRQQQDFTAEMQQYDINQANLNDWRERSLAGIKADTARAIARDAEQLDLLQQIYGGL